MSEAWKVGDTPWPSVRWEGGSATLDEKGSVTLTYRSKPDKNGRQRRMMASIPLGALDALAHLATMARQ